jgi:hypothetical protein
VWERRDDREAAVRESVSERRGQQRSVKLEGGSGERNSMGAAVCV